MSLSVRTWTLVRLPMPSAVARRLFTDDVIVMSLKSCPADLSVNAQPPTSTAAPTIAPSETRIRMAGLLCRPASLQPRCLAGSWRTAGLPPPTIPSGGPVCESTTECVASSAGWEPRMNRPAPSRPPANDLGLRQPSQLPLGTLCPVLHAKHPEAVDRQGDGRPRGGPAPGACVEPAEVEPAALGERAHAEHGGERNRVLVRAGGRGVLAGGGLDVTEHPCRAHLEATRADRASAIERLVGEPPRLLGATGLGHRLGEPDEPETLRVAELYRLAARRRALEHRERFRGPAEEPVGVTQWHLDHRQRERKVPSLAEAARVLEGGDRLRELALKERQHAGGEVGLRGAVELLGGRGELEHLGHATLRLVELAPLGQAPDEPRAREDGRRADHAEPVPRDIAPEGADRAAQVGDRFLVVSQAVVRLAEILMADGAERFVTKGLGDIEGATAGFDRAAGITDSPSRVRERRGDSP